MINIQYYSHLLLNSKYSFLIKLTIFLAIYMLFYIDNIQDVAYCAKKQGAKKAAEIARAVPASEVSAVPFIAESKDEVVRGFHEQLRTIQIDSKAKHEEIITRLDEIKRNQIGCTEPLDLKMEERTPYIDRLIERNSQLAEEKQELVNQLNEQERSRRSASVYLQDQQRLERMSWADARLSVEKQNKHLIKQVQEMRKTNLQLRQQITEQDQTIRVLMAEQLPTFPDIEEAPTPRQGNYEAKSCEDIEAGRDVQRMRPAAAYLNNREAHTPADIYQYLGNCTIN